jgi:hypothetical protein
MSTVRKSATFKKTPTPSKKFEVHVPGAVMEKLDKTWNFLWDKSCPFGSLYIWFMVGLGLYYLFWLPDLNLTLSQDGTLDTRKVDKTLRGFLLLSVIISSIVGYYIVRKGCINAGPSWAFLWFLIALVITSVITQLILALAEKVSIPNAYDLLKQINKN